MGVAPAGDSRPFPPPTAPPAAFDSEGPERAPKVAEVVARMILDDADRMSLQPGDQLMPESKMMELYAVGRASVREALRILEVQGVVSIRTGRNGGPVLERLRTRRVGNSLKLYFQQRRATYGDVLDARQAIEPQVARRAATQATGDHEREIRRLLAEVEQIGLDEHAKLGAATQRLSAAVGTASENPALALLVQALRDIYSWRVHAWFTDERLWTLLLDQFRTLAGAIEAGDEEAAHDAMRTALVGEVTFARRHFPEVLGERVHWD